MQSVQSIHIEGAGLIDGIGSNTKSDGFDFGTVSFGADKTQETEKLSKGEKTTEVTYQKPQQDNQAGTMEDVMQQAGNMDAAMMKNQMVVASNTTTTTDCKKMEQDGFSLPQMDTETIVTVTDKIKIELAKAGVDISYFGDSLSAEQLEEISGNAVLAQKLAGKIQQMQADLPLTADNIEDCKKSLQEASELHKPNDGAVKYMLDNQLEPTIANLYKAQYSGSAIYMNPDAAQIDLSGMQEQISRVIAQSGLTENEQTISASHWMIQNDIPLTPDNLNYYMQLNSLSFPQNEEELLEAMVTSIAEGKRPQDAMLLDGFSLMAKAQQSVDSIQNISDQSLAYIINKGENITIKNLETAQNQIDAGALSPEELADTDKLIQNAADIEKQAGDGLNGSSADNAADSAASGSTTDNAADSVSNASSVGYAQEINTPQNGSVLQTADTQTAAVPNTGTAIGAGQTNADTVPSATVQTDPNMTAQSAAQAERNAMQGASAAQNDLNTMQGAAKTAQTVLETAGIRQPSAEGAVRTDSAAQPVPSKDISAGQAVSAAESANDNSGNMQDQSGSMSRHQSSQYAQIEIVYITARRQLEEVRLMMTVESSYSMLKQGISVDTQSMEDLINRLKAIENSYYKNLLSQGGVEPSEENVSLFAETSEKLEQLKEMPAYALGARNMEISTLDDLHQEGSRMQQTFQQANERYETMQTQVRADLGDSIQKAFRNVDDILKDIGQTVSPANERAVRILGYNQIEINTENLLRMKTADQQVQMAFRNMTPSVIREFIDRDINPMDMDIRELNRYAEQIKSELNIHAPEDKYSEYLYKLEQNHSISEDERTAYIGIYRLMNQVVQSDGAAIGALVNQGAQITMRNLLAAVRSERHSNMDITIDQSFGELKSGGYRDSITDQIEAGYQNNCVRQALDELSPERMRAVANDTKWDELTPEQFLEQLKEAPEDLAAEESYYKHQLEDLTQCAKSSQEVYKMLERYDLPNTVMNVMAVSEFMHNRNRAFQRLFHTDLGRKPDSAISTEPYMSKDEDGNAEVDFNAIKEELLRRFGEDIKKPEDLAQAVAELAECAEKCMSTMILEPNVTSLDIRELKLMNAQLSIGAKMASTECFSMPIEVDGEITNVTLKIVRNKEQKGLINITLETSRLGKIAAELKAKQSGITGYVATNSRQSRDLLRSMHDDITKALQDEEGSQVDINYITSGRLDLNYFAESSGSSEEPESEELREIQTKTLYGMAEGFIKVLKQLDAS